MMHLALVLVLTISGFGNLKSFERESQRAERTPGREKKERKLERGRERLLEYEFLAQA